MSKTAEEIRTSLKKNIAYENPQIDLASGNVATDLGVNAFSEELSAAYDEQDRVRNIYLLDSASFSDAEADKLAASFGIYRLSATYATGEVVFCATALPAAGSHFTIPIGVIVTTSGESTGVKQFKTTATAVIDENTPFNPNTNYYETFVPVQAVAEGTNSNVGAGAINQLATSVTGIAAVYNQNSIVNGTAVETTEELIERVRLKLRGFVYGTKASYLAKVFEDPRVKDAVVVDPDSPFSVRGPGSIDIYVLGDEKASYTQRVTDTTKQSVQLTKTPFVAGSMLITFPDQTIAPASKYTVSVDDHSVYASSGSAKDTLIWDTQYFIDTVSTYSYYEITYTYNRLISDLQTTFQTSDYNIITSNVLVKKTDPIYAAMDFDIVTLASYDGTTVRANVLYAIQQFVNNFPLNKPLRQSDIIGIVENTEGVDYMKLPMRQFSEAGTTGVYDVESSPLEYIRIEASDIQIG